MDKWVVIAGDLYDGLQYCVGPFSSEVEAELYLDCFNLKHYDKFVRKMDKPDERWGQVRLASDEKEA